MKRMLFYGILIFIFSFGIGYYYSNLWKDNQMQKQEMQTESLAQNTQIQNEVTVETSQEDEKIAFDAEFALKKYYNSCGHFTFQYAELPPELVNLNRNEVQELYKDWEIEEFSSNSLVLRQAVDDICDEHYMIKLGESNIEIYQVGKGDTLNLYKQTDISRDYLTSEDIQTLEEGIKVYGNGKLNSAIEDFE